MPYMNVRFRCYEQVGPLPYRPVEANPWAAQVSMQRLVSLRSRSATRINVHKQTENSLLERTHSQRITNISISKIYAIYVKEFSMIHCKCKSYNTVSMSPNQSPAYLTVDNYVVYKYIINSM